MRLKDRIAVVTGAGAYAERWGGIRVEDNVLITGSGAEVLGPFETRLGR